MSTDRPKASYGVTIARGVRLGNGVAPAYSGPLARWRFPCAVFCSPPLLFAGFAQAADPIAIDVYRDPNCGCCKAWIEHLEDNGFAVADHVVNDMTSVKMEHGVPHRLGSCHTGVIDGKFVEGHVPAADILKLRAQPDLIGAAVPGMPVGSPGMEMGERKDAFQVIGVSKQGKESVISEYPGN